MREPIRISDAADPRLADFVGLTDVALRRVKEPAEGLFVAEGEKVIRRAIAAGYVPRAVFSEPTWWPGLRDACASFDAPVYLAEPDVVREITGYSVHRGALASMQRKALPSVADVLADARRIVALEGLVDHANVGAIFRCAAALGADAVILDSACADPLYRRSVKVSMGSVFAIRWTRDPSWPASLTTMADLGVRRLALTPAVHARDLRDVAAEVRAEGSAWCVVFGTEGDGLSSQALAQVEDHVRIPMSHGVDSLNVGSAAAIVLYTLG